MAEQRGDLELLDDAALVLPLLRRIAGGGDTLRADVERSLGQTESLASIWLWAAIDGAAEDGARSPSYRIGSLASVLDWVHDALERMPLTPEIAAPLHQFHAVLERLLVADAEYVQVAYESPGAPGSSGLRLASSTLRECALFWRGYGISLAGVMSSLPFPPSPSPEIDALLAFLDDARDRNVDFFVTWNG